MILLNHYEDQRFFYTVEWWDDDDAAAYLKIWEGEWVIREIVCNGCYSALSEAQHWLDETLELRMVAKSQWWAPSC